MMGWGSMYFTGYRSPTEWAELGLMGDKLSFTDDDTVNRLGIGYIKNQNVECAMDTAVRYTLLNAGENGEINAKQMLNQYTRLAALVEEGIVADGWYEDDEGKHRDWVYHEDGIRLHWNHVSSSYRYDNAHFSANVLNAKIVDKYDSGYTGRAWSIRLGHDNYEHYRSDLKKHWAGASFVLHPLRKNIRAMTHYLEDKVVLRAINKSLNRMVKSEKAVQVTAGRGRTFRWDAWGWLDKYRQKHLVTMAKQRKLGDKVNGWEFTKGRITNMFGVEICDHEWIPVTPVETHHIRIRCPSWTKHHWSSEHIVWNSIQLPHLFFDKEQAEQVAKELGANSYPREGLAIRLNGKQLSPSFEVYTRIHKMSVGGAAMIEDYQEPLVMFERMQLGTKEMFSMYEDKLRHSPDKIAGSEVKEE